MGSESRRRHKQIYPDAKQPDQVDQLLGKGDDAVKQQKYSVADDIYTKAIEIMEKTTGNRKDGADHDARLGGAYFNRGTLNDLLNHGRDALRDYDRALRLGGDFPKDQAVSRTEKLQKLWAVPQSDNPSLYPDFKVIQPPRP